MSEINVLSKTQVIVVDPLSGSVSIINAGPPGPAGSEGPPGPPGPPGGPGTGTGFPITMNDGTYTYTIDIQYQSLTLTTTTNIGTIRESQMILSNDGDAYIESGNKILLGAHADDAYLWMYADGTGVCEAFMAVTDPTSAATGLDGGTTRAGGTTFYAKCDQNIWEGPQNTPIPDSDLGPSTFSIWLDDTAGAANLMYKAKDSAGTVVAGPLGGVGEGEEYAESYHHIQSTASTTWSIPHNLNFNPNVTTIDTAGGQIFGEVTYNNTDLLTVTYSVAVAGEAYLS